VNQGLVLLLAWAQFALLIGIFAWLLLRDGTG